MTEARTCRAHLVTDEAAAAGRVNAGRYVAICGTVVLPASLTAPEASYCTSCTYWHKQGSRMALVRGGSPSRNREGANGN